MTSTALHLAPASWKPYLELMRLHQPTGIWLLLLPSLWGITLAPGGWLRWDLMLLFLVGAIVMRSAGCVINDWWDRDIDRHVARTATRPLADHRLSARQAFILLAALLACGLLILLQLPRVSILLGVASLPLIILYPLMKRLTWWPQLFLGITFNLGIPIGYAAVTQTTSPACWLFYLSAIFWTLSYDTVYAHQDKQDDALIGVKSTARKLGRYTQPVVSLWLLHMAALIIIAGAVAELHWPFYAVALASMAYNLGLLWRTNLDQATCAMHFFKAQRWVGLMIWSALIVAAVSKHMM